jgi:hypothetical protein
MLIHPKAFYVGANANNPQGQPFQFVRHATVLTVMELLANNISSNFF